MNALIEVIQRAQAVAEIRAPHVPFTEMLSALLLAKYTGPLTVHFAEGHPKGVQIPNPVRVKVS